MLQSRNTKSGSVFSDDEIAELKVNSLLGIGKRKYYSSKQKNEHGSFSNFSPFSLRFSVLAQHLAYRAPINKHINCLTDWDTFSLNGLPIKNV